MGLKKKVFGFVAAAALTLSMAGGVAAQAPDTDSVDGSVVLEAGACKVSIVQSDVSFGTWTWNGTAYGHTGGHNVVTLNANLETHKPGGKCEGSIVVEGLSDGTDTIPAKHFSGSVSGDHFSGNSTNLGSVFGDDTHSGTINFPGMEQGSTTATLTLVSVPNTFQPGNYSGSVTVTVGPAN